MNVKSVYYNVKEQNSRNKTDIVEVFQRIGPQIFFYYFSHLNVNRLQNISIHVKEVSCMHTDTCTQRKERGDRGQLTNSKTSAIT